MPSPTDIDTLLADTQTATATLQADVTTLVGKYVELRSNGTVVTASELQNWFDSITGIGNAIKAMAASVDGALNG